jgi:hypothetical protein
MMTIGEATKRRSGSFVSGVAADFMLPGPGNNSSTFCQVVKIFKIFLKFKIIGLSDAPETVNHRLCPSLSRGNILERGPQAACDSVKYTESRR